MGSAIECFDNAGAVVVPRERFAPVTTTNDLFLLRSDVYTVRWRCLLSCLGRAPSAPAWKVPAWLPCTNRLSCSLDASSARVGHRRRACSAPPEQRGPPVFRLTCSTCSCSSAAQVTDASTVVLTVPAAPSVKLDDKYYKLVDKMEALCEAPPSLKDAKSLTVKGPVLFRKGCVFKGDTLVVNGAAHSCAMVLLGAMICGASWTASWTPSVSRPSLQECLGGYLRGCCLPHGPAGAASGCCCTVPYHLQGMLRAEPCC